MSSRSAYSPHQPPHLCHVPGSTTPGDVDSITLGGASAVDQSALESQNEHPFFAPGDASFRAPDLNDAGVAQSVHDGHEPWIEYADRGWRRVVQNFVPAWFAVVMGTGIVSILLRHLPYPHEPSVPEMPPAWLRWTSTVVFILNVLLFVIIFLISALRYILYPKTWPLMVHHPVQGMYLGAAPMAFSTIVTMFAVLCVGDFRWGAPSGWAEMFCWALWWLMIVASVAVAIGVFFVMITSHNISLPSQTASMLLPIVAPIVASACGAVVAGSLTNPHHALVTLTVSYILWGMGVPNAMLVLALYFHRLALYKLPPKEMVVSSFLPLGPLGQGGYALIKLGQVARTVYPATHTANLDTYFAAVVTGRVFGAVGFFVATIMWGFGLVWLCFAVGAVLRGRFSFNLSWWAFTFPLGVFAMCTIAIGQEMPSAMFRLLGTIFAVAVICLWMMVSVLTIKHACSSDFFCAPGVQDKGCDEEKTPS